MHKAVDSTKREFSGIRSGKASTSLLDLVRVEAYGSTCRSTRWRWSRRPSRGCSPSSRSTSPSPRPSRRPSATPTSASTRRRRATSSGSRCRRSRRSAGKELVKVVHKLAEEGRVAVRHARTDTMTKIKKLEHISEDDKTRAEKDVQKLTDEHIRQIDGLIKSKEAEIMEV